VTCRLCETRWLPRGKAGLGPFQGSSFPLSKVIAKGNNLSCGVPTICKSQRWEKSCSRALAYIAWGAASLMQFQKHQPSNERGNLNHPRPKVHRGRVRSQLHNLRNLILSRRKGQTTLPAGFQKPNVSSRWLPASATPQGSKQREFGVDSCHVSVGGSPLPLDVLFTD
jgi:hypothetical protein